MERMTWNKGQRGLYMDMYNVQTAIPRPICLCRRFNSTLMKTWQGEHFWDADTRRGCGCGNGHVLSCLSWWPANKTNCTSSEARRPRVRGHSQEQHARSQVPQPAASSTACQCCCHQSLGRRFRKEAWPNPSKVRIEDDVCCSVHMRKRNFVVIYGPCRTCNMHAGQTNQRCCCCVRWCCCCSDAAAASAAAIAAAAAASSAITGWDIGIRRMHCEENFAEQNSCLTLCFEKTYVLHITCLENSPFWHCYPNPIISNCQHTTLFSLCKNLGGDWGGVARLGCRCRCDGDGVADVRVANDPAIHADDDDLVAKLRGGTLLKEAALASHLAR